MPDVKPTRWTIIEYQQAQRLLVALVPENPFAETAQGDVACFFCQEYQSNVQKAQHSAFCPWTAAHSFLEEHGSG